MNILIELIEKISSKLMVSTNLYFFSRGINPSIKNKYSKITWFKKETSVYFAILNKISLKLALSVAAGLI